MDTSGEMAPHGPVYRDRIVALDMMVMSLRAVLEQSTDFSCLEGACSAIQNLCRMANLTDTRDVTMSGQTDVASLAAPLVDSLNTTLVDDWRAANPLYQPAWLQILTALRTIQTIRTADDANFASIVTSTVLAVILAHVQYLFDAKLTTGEVEDTPEECKQFTVAQLVDPPTETGVVSTCFDILKDIYHMSSESGDNVLSHVRDMQVAASSVLHVVPQERIGTMLRVSCQ